MALTRPSSDFKDKTNVNPIGTRSQEATAEDFQEAGYLFNEQADAIEALQLSTSPNPFYGRYTTLALLQAAYPTGEVDAWAVIDAGAGITPLIAFWDDIGSTWEISGAVNNIVKVANYAALPGPGTEDIYYITLDDFNVYLWYGSQYNLILESELNLKLAHGGYTGTGQELKDAIDAILSSLYQTNKIINVLYRWVSGYTYEIIYVKWIKEGVVYEQFFNEQITLNAADGTNNRRDQIILDINTATLEKSTGTPATSPILNPLEVYQLFLFEIPVDATTTEPAGVSNEDIYLENTEWTSSVSGSVDADSVALPDTGTKSIKFTAAAAGDYVLLDNGSEFDITNVTSLIIRIYLPTAGVNQTFTIVSANATNSYSLAVFNNKYGFKKTTTSQWQTIIIPKADLGPLNDLLQSIKIINSTAGATFYIDNIQLELGTQTSTSTTYVEEAPEDDIQYARKNKAWEAIVGVGGDMLAANNLSEVDPATARTNLGLNTTANQSSSTDKNFVTDAEKTQITTNQTAITALTSSYSRRKAVIDYVDNTTVPPTEVSGDRYILDDTGASHANWDGASAFDIVEFDGTNWVAVTPLEGFIAYVDSLNQDALFVDDGTPAWEFREASVANAISNATDKTTPVDTDIFGLVDTVLKKVTWANIKATLKTYFDTLYSTATGVENNADVTDATNVDAAGAVMESDYDANTILAATTDNTPVALTVGEETFVGRITGGNITALTKTQVQTFIQDRMLVNATVTTAQTLDYSLYESFNFIMTADTTFSESNLPTSGTNGKVIIINMTGDFSPTYPAGWSTNISGVYDGTVQNTIVVWYISTGVYKVQITQPD